MLEKTVCWCFFLTACDLHIQIQIIGNSCCAISLTLNTAFVSMAPHISQDMRERMVVWSEEGQSPQEIANLAVGGVKLRE